MPKAPRLLPSLPPPSRANPAARANSELDKTWGQGHANRTNRADIAGVALTITARSDRQVIGDRETLQRSRLTRSADDVFQFQRKHPCCQLSGAASAVTNPSSFSVCSMLDGVTPCACLSATAESK